MCAINGIVPLQASGTFNYDQHFILHNDQTAEPLVSTPYRLTTPSGQVIEGISDEQGRTLLASSKAAEGVTVEVIEEEEGSA